jgi:hypothetical protein
VLAKRALEFCCIVNLPTRTTLAADRNATGTIILASSWFAASAKNEFAL